MRVSAWVWLVVMSCAGRPGGGCMRPLMPDDVQVVVCAEEGMAPDTGDEWEESPEWETGWASEPYETGWWGGSETGW